MNKLILALLCIVSFNTAFAGGGSGGGTLGQERVKEAVLVTGENEEEVRVEHAVLVEGQWQQQTLIIEKNKFAVPINVNKALERSKETKEWQEIKE